MEAISVLGSTFGTPSQSGVFSVLGSTFDTPSQSGYRMLQQLFDDWTETTDKIIDERDKKVTSTSFAGIHFSHALNTIAIQCNLLQLEETPTAFELPSVLGSTFSSPNITTNLSYFPSYNSVIPDNSLESNESNSVVNFMVPRVYATKEYSFEKAFEDSEVNTTSDFEISNSEPVKKCKNIKPRFGIRKYKISTAREDYFQGTVVSSSDESGITKHNKRCIKFKKNRKASVHKDFQGACASSIDGSEICKTNEYSRESKNSISNAQGEDFQTEFGSSVEESEVRKNSKCKGSKNRNKFNATNINFPTRSTSLAQSKVASRNPQVDKTNPIDEEKVFEIIPVSKLNSASENDYQTDNEVEEEEKEKVPEINSLSMINNSSEDSDDDYLANIASNKSLKSAKLIASNNSQIQLGSNHSSNKRKESFQSNISKPIPQLELNSIEPKLDKTNLIPKSSFEAASISFDCATVNHIYYKKKKVSETISTSKLNNDSENSEDDYQANSEEVSEINSLSKMNNSSEDSDDECLANIVSNKSSKSATLISSIISEVQSGSRKKRSFQTMMMKSNPQLELNSTYNIVPFRESREELTGALNIDVHSELNGSKNVSRRLTKHSAFRNLDRLNYQSPTNLNNEISHLMFSTPFSPEFQWFTNNKNNSLVSVLPSCRSNVDSAQTITSLDEFPNQHSKETEETLNFIRELKEINYNSKQPLKTLNHIEINNFAENCPFSELRPNKNKKPTVPENGATYNQVLQKDKIKTAAKVLKRSLPKSTPLSRPKKWVTNRLYNFLFEKLSSNYGIRYRLEAQKLVMFMVEKVTEALNKTEDYDVPVEELKMELARKKIIETNRDFFNFVREFLDRDFYQKSVPNSRPTLQKQIIRFTPGTIDDKILQS